MAWLTHLVLRVGWYLGQWLDWIRFELWGESKVFRIAVVGDLSLQDPVRLEKALLAAVKECPDVIVQVGDMAPGYKVVASFGDDVKRDRPEGKRILVMAVPGNHDIEWDEKLKWPRIWSMIPEPPLCVLLGLDNSKDTFSEKDWAEAEKVKALGIDPIIVFVHKPISTVVLPDGSTSFHIMGESGSAQSHADALRLQEMFKGRDVLFVHGHYHNLTVFRPTSYDGLVLVDGRGGAAPEIGYSIIVVTEEGIVIHSKVVAG